MHTLNLSPKPLAQLAMPPRLVTPPRPRLTAASPALEVLTDFSRHAPRTIPPEMGVDEAHLMMRHGGIRLLLVVDDRQRCIGVLAAREVIGGRRITLAMQQHDLPRGEITVGMIMTPWHKLAAMSLEQLASLTIEDLLLSLEAMTDQHLLVTERDDQGGDWIRGLVSAADIRRAVGAGDSASQGMPLAHSFADICRVVTGHEL
ncbi:CBS domain-containing protein [Halomonas shengliensis]|uniref:CBS domain-containing protein n=3 Tax=Halomonas TaxID=2745 RepID=A0A1H0F7I3_9GAMM|nr:CBS domain-containing protein [Halomonas shengliensis]SDN90604.1 CBS domain-containing protein [Halomonas shengliensis]